MEQNNSFFMQERFLVREKTKRKANIRRNWYFPISALAFFCLNITVSVEFILGAIIAVISAFVIASQCESLFKYVKEINKYIHMISIGTAVGVCLANYTRFYSIYSTSPYILAMEEIIPIQIDITRIVGIWGCISALAFVYIFVILCLSRTIKLIKNSNIFGDIGKAELLLYVLLVIVLLSFILYTYTNSSAFFGTKIVNENDVIYTSDSFAIVQNNAYLVLRHNENDIRQPLFAIFAAPFVGMPYMLSRLIRASATVQAIMLNSVQILMLFIANFMLARMLKLNSVKRFCFMAITFCTYTQLLFSLMMEQYIVAYFWLILCMYLIVEKGQLDRLALWGAGGTLLTSMILLPFMTTKSPIKEFKVWFLEIVKCGFEFIILMLVFCRFDVIFNIIPRISYLSGFTGKAVTFAEKICQYTAFIGNCFIAPNADVNITYVDHISWQLKPVTEINFVGVLILILVVISAIWNRNKKSALLSASWAGFSVIILLVLGWGTQENGLILYALYFGWSFFVLLFQLVEKIECKLRIKFLIPSITVIVAITLLKINIPAIIELVNFAITYYPA